MRLEQVTGRPFIVRCVGCSEKVYAGDVDATNHPKYPVFADLDGKPFEAYYCNECVGKLRQAEEGK